MTAPKKTRKGIAVFVIVYDIVVDSVFIYFNPKCVNADTDLL
jgi:hypothetical protein